MTAKKKALGRGLSALLENDSNEDISKITDEEERVEIINTVTDIPVEKIEPNPDQPRKEFFEDSIAELAESIEKQGIIQPLTIRKVKQDVFQVISGERRLKAAKKAGLKTVPAYVRFANDHEMIQMALVENIQREDLNPMEIAVTFKRLIEECDLTQESLSTQVGKKRSTVSNYLRLLNLPSEIQAGLRDKKITFGHAKTIANIEDEKQQLGVYYQIVNKGLSVRASEELLKQQNKKNEVQKKPSKALPPEFAEKQVSISEKLHSNIQIRLSNKGKGQIVIPFRNKEDFDKIADILSRIND